MQPFCAINFTLLTGARTRFFLVLSASFPPPGMISTTLHGKVIKLPCVFLIGFGCSAFLEKFSFGIKSYSSYLVDVFVLLNVSVALGIFRFLVAFKRFDGDIFKLLYSVSSIFVTHKLAERLVLFTFHIVSNFGPFFKHFRDSFAPQSICKFTPFSFTQI